MSKGKESGKALNARTRVLCVRFSKSQRLMSLYQLRLPLQPKLGKAVSLHFRVLGRLSRRQYFFRFRDVIVKRSALSRNLVSRCRGKAITLPVVISLPFAKENRVPHPCRVLCGRVGTLASGSSAL